MVESTINKDKIKELINRYNSLKSSGKIAGYNEEMTKKNFILPLFEALGWKTDSDAVTAEEKISKDRVDYGFYINDIPKFYLEAKSLRESNLPINERYIKQAINYAWNKACTWAVLTNFEVLIVFNAELDPKKALTNWFIRSLAPEDLLKAGTRINLLSREAMGNNELDKFALSVGKERPRLPIDQQLLEDLMWFRELLSKSIIKNNTSKKLSEDQVDESVQRILDRLIFIRNTEDRNLERNQLRSNLREWESRGKGNLIKEINGVYRDYDLIYNSKLFSHNLCDDLELDDDVLKTVIEGLYSSRNETYSYDFSAIEANVLGNIYEQYLGNLLNKTKKSATLKESHSHRKEQGIYYTPNHIVDYIIRTTLGELLKDKKADISKIRILDPACGSGSFLMKAYDTLEKYYKINNPSEFKDKKLDMSGADATYSKKIEILKDNIFGVDLDPKATEIAQLNLLLKVSEKGKRLPILQNNIKIGNSIIDDYKVAGDRAFNWDAEFGNKAKKAEFDVIVGNPPYDVIYSSKNPQEFKYYKQKYEVTSAQYNPNLFAIFIDKMIDLLAPGAYLGFITPDTLLTNKYFYNLRKKILDTCSIKLVVDLSSGIFKEAIVDTIILILKREKIKENEVWVGKLNSLEELRNNKLKLYPINQSKWVIAKGLEFQVRTNTLNDSIVKKLETNSVTLNTIGNIKRGMVTKNNKDFIFNEKTKNKCKDISKLKKVIVGKDATRYHLNYSGNYIFFDRSAIGGGCWDKNVYEAKEKILIALITGGMRYRINACLDNSGYYTLQNYNCLLIDDKDFDINYILGLLNSKLLNWYYAAKFNDKNIKRMQLLQLPIKKLNLEEQTKVAALVKKLQEETTRLLDMPRTDEKTKTEERIQVLDTEIDNFIYKLYGLDEEEKRTIENSFK